MNRTLVTGAAGFIGSQVVDRLAETAEFIMGIDIRDRGGHPHHQVMDIRDPDLGAFLADHRIDQVVHLAAIVSPQPHHTREFLHEVEVEGTRHVVNAALSAGVTHLTVTSSGAAYGYHRDHPDWITENVPLRGNVEFAYSDHKRQVEELLADVARSNPELGQLVLRPGTILGPAIHNQLTALFERRVVLGIARSPTPFVFIWDTDVVDIITKGVAEHITGAFNVAGDGAIPLRALAKEMHKPYIALPAWFVKGTLAVLGRFNLVPYGPEQVDFLRYRPVLSNDRLKTEFGFTPTKTSVDAFRAFVAAND